MSETENDPKQDDSALESGSTASTVITRDITDAAGVDDAEKKSEELQLEWYKNVYKGDDTPQFTLRAVLMGGFLGALMSVSNLYTAIKVGWLFGVAITACVLSFTIWRACRFVNPKLSEMGILENNCMQSTASSAGYSTGSTLATAFGAYLLITGHHIDFGTTMIWTFATALLGVLLAVPMKKQMINKERLPFPSGIAAAETLKSLHGGSKESIKQAYSLVTAMALGILTGVASKGEWDWQKVINFKLPELIPFPGVISHLKLNNLPGFGFEPSLLLMSAGMIVGMRASVSMLFSSCVLYFYFAPWLVNNHFIVSPAKLLSWALWTGTSIMVAAGLTSFAMQWKTIVRAFKSIMTAGASKQDSPLAVLDRIEVPTKWFVVGVIPVGIFVIFVENMAFHIDYHLGLLSVVMSFFLALVACRSTGETDITPIGAMGKISQLTFAVVKPHNMTANLMAASVTANCASASADLLTDLKSGYLLGANARRQFLAQACGVIFGTLTVVPAWFLMIPDKESLDKYHPPMTYLYKTVAEALSVGISGLPETARTGIVAGLLIGCVLTVLETLYPRLRKFLPSPMGLGLAWIMPFQNCFSFCIGAVIALIWGKINQKNAEGFVIPVASGAIAGESLACAFIAMFNAAVKLLHIAP